MTTAPYSLQEFDIDHMVTGIWTSVLGQQIARCNVDDLDLSGTLSGVIDVRGDWNGAVLFRCSPAVARDTAAVMGNLAPEQCAQEDLDDAVCELCNMTAGGVKALLPGSCTMSLPQYLGTADPGSKIAHLTEVGSYGFHCKRQPIAISVFAAQG